MASGNSFERGEVKQIYKGRRASMHSVAHKNVYTNEKMRKGVEYQMFNWHTESVRALFYDPDTDKLLVELRPDVAALDHGWDSYTVGAFEEAPRELEAFRDTTRRIGERIGCRLKNVWHVGSAYPGPATLGTRVQFTVGHISIEEAPLSLDRYRVISASDVEKLLSGKEKPIDASAFWLLSWFKQHRNELRQAWPPAPANPEAPAEAKQEKPWPTFKGRILRRKKTFESRRRSVEEVRVAHEISNKTGIGAEFGVASHEILDPKSKSVFVVLYDPKLNKVALIEEFKPAPDAFRESPFVLSTPAGNVEKGESPLAAAMREVTEETGISVSEENLKSLGKVYADRQVGTESHLFVANVDLSKQIDGNVFGLAGQNEMTRLRIYSVEEAGQLFREHPTHLVADAAFLRFLDKKPEIDREWKTRPAVVRTAKAPAP